jgi:hypothetical protein
MKKLSSHITIGKWSFDYVVDVVINQSIETLTDNCTITIPRKLQWNGAAIAMGDSQINAEPILKRSDKVVIETGYDGVLKTRFIGYLKDIKTGVPVTLTCEDSMFLLKKGSITKSYPARHTLKQLLTDILPSGVEFVVPDGADLVYLQPVNYTKVTPAKILEELKSDGIYSYFRNISENGVTRAVLYSGLAYWTNRKERSFKYSFNIIKDDLTYKRAEDISLKVTAISISRDNKKIEKSFGDDDGEVRTLHFFELTEADLEQYAKKEIERLKVTGYYGNFTTFGVPSIEKGDVAKITGNEYHPDGSYLVKSNKIEFGQKGYREIPVLDTMISTTTGK